MKRTRGYALILVLMVLALLGIGLGTLLSFQEGSADTTGSLYERRRVFYACDGIGRAATVVAQDYISTSAPSPQGLIDAVCSVGGGGCCATTADTSTDPTAGSCETTPNATRTRLTNDPTGNGPTALPFLTPTGFKITELELSSEAKACTLDAECNGGTCTGGFCRVVGELPNGPFQGMTARQDTISFGLTAEHRATTKFRCSTAQTMTLGKIAMFQFFLFSDSAYTDWHPGVIMRASGRMHANGNVGLNGRIRIARVTASGTIGCITGATPPAVNPTCTEDDVMIAKVAVPSMTDDADFADFDRDNATWRTAALSQYGNGNAQDAAHGVPRLQLPIVGQPDVQKGFDAANNPIANLNSAVVNGATRVFPNSRLLVDPVRPVDTVEIKRQKFAHNADVRIINGTWFLKDPADEDAWPGVPIWSDHGSHTLRAAEEFVAAPTNVGQSSLPATVASAWTRVPQRYSYYGVQNGSTRLSRDLGPAALASLRPPFSQTAVISYGSLFRDATSGDHGAVWRPGLRSIVHDSGAIGWCKGADAEDDDAEFRVIDALAVGGGAGTPCDALGVGLDPTQAAALLAAARSGFRDGFAELEACDDDDNVSGNPSTCNGGTGGDRRRGNILPMNFDLHAFQEALADTTSGELGSYFCPVGVATCGAFMKRPFNGIVYLGAPYPGSERGYGSNGGSDLPAQLPVPGRIHDDTGAVTGSVNHAGHLKNAGLAGGRPRHDADPGADDFDWNTTGVGNVPLLVDRGESGKASEYEEARDDEVAALPYPLCSDASSSEELSSGGYVFVRPDCNAEATFTRLNAVRIINARRVNTNTAPTTTADIADASSLPPFAAAPVLSSGAEGQLPQGISIVSNLPVYVVGDVNLTSDAWAAPSAAAPWVPVLVGGDVVHLLSNAWDDENARWAQSMGRQERFAAVTRYHMQILGGWGMSVPGAGSGGIHNFPRALENWKKGDVGKCKGSGDFSGACPAIIRGSLVIGHNRVYTGWRFVEEDGEDPIGRKAPRRDWGFDPHLNNIDLQPPGTPLFDVAAIRQWSRR